MILILLSSFSSCTVLYVLHAQMWLLACGREHLALPCSHSGTLDQFTTILGRRRLAVVMCIPPRGYVECLIHVGRVMGGGDTPYDIVVFSGDCGWAVDPEWFTGITRWRLKELYESLDGLGSSVVGCTEWPAQHVGPADSWSAWFEKLHPEKLGLNRYQSLVLISPEGVHSLLGFSLDRVRHSMWLAGAHVAMPSLSYSDDHDDDDVTGGSGRQQPPEYYHNAGYCLRWTGANSLPSDPPILVFTASAWECAWRKLQNQHGDFIPILLPHLSSVICSPRGALSACDMGQSCLLVDHSHVHVLRAVNDNFDSKNLKMAQDSSTRQLSDIDMRPFPYGLEID